MSKANVNIDDVISFQNSIKSETETLNGINANFSQQLAEIKEQVKQEKKKINVALDNCKKGINKLTIKIEELNEKLELLRAKLAAMPPTITTTVTDDEGNSSMVEKTNPEYLDIQNQIVEIEQKIETSKKLLMLFKELQAKATQQIMLLEQVVAQLQELREEIGRQLSQLEGYSEEAISKLNNIEQTLQEYMNTKIETPNLSSADNIFKGGSGGSTTTEENGLFGWLSGIGKSKSFDYCSTLVLKDEYKNNNPMYTLIDKLSVKDEYKKILCENFNNLDNRAKKIYKNYAKDLVCNSVLVDGSAYYSKIEGGFKINYLEDEKNELGKGNTFYHESAHMLDDLLGKKIGNSLGVAFEYCMPENIHEDYENAVKKVMLDRCCSEQEAKKYIKEDLRCNPIASHIVSDLFGGVTLNEVKGVYGHSKDYWSKPGSNILLGNEAFAELYACVACNNNESLEFTKKYMPRTINKFMKILEDFGNEN